MWFAPWLAVAAGPGEEAVVIYNTALEDSKAVVAHYVAARQVPANQVIGLALPRGETMTRAEFREQLQAPLLRELSERGLWQTRIVLGDFSPPNAPAVTEAKIRYAVLCHGVPLKITADPALKETSPANLPGELRRNDAAVDSELALLPLAAGRHPLTGIVPNRVYAATNVAALHPTNGVLIVARLDGPTPAIARGLVDKALAAERDGLWGRAYFDARGLREGPYLMGDEWLRKAAEIARRYGLETLLDERPETFSAGFPLSQVMFYAGWYDGGVSGPFTRAQVEFMPGAVAYHLHSFSATTLRSAEKNWCGPLLAKGATATLGCVEEPYLAGTPDLGVLFHRLTVGWTFGEAALAAQGSLSWQTTVIGDPLYRPLGRHPAELHADLLKWRSALLAWSHLRVVNLNLLRGTSATEMIGYLREQPETTNSAVLLEKLGDLQLAAAKPALAVDAWEQALALQPTPQQRVRLLFARGEQLTQLGRAAEAVKVWQELVELLPPSPEQTRARERRAEADARARGKP